jgi:26S proteasome regulatory subunit N1
LAVSIRYSPSSRRHLAAEIGEEYTARQATDDSATDATADLHELALRLVPFLLAHNGEADAVDLLLELESISSIVDHVDENSYSRVCLYMVSCVNLLVPPDDREFLRTARRIYLKQNRLTHALTLSIRLHDKELMLEDFQAAKTPCV